MVGSIGSVASGKPAARNQRSWLETTVNGPGAIIPDYQQTYMASLPAETETYDFLPLATTPNHEILYIVDGGRGDDDLLVNGVILDLGGPGVLPA